MCFFLQNTMCYLKGWLSSFCVPTSFFLLHPLWSNFPIGLKQILQVSQYSSHLSSASPEAQKLQGQQDMISHLTLHDLLVARVSCGRCGSLSMSKDRSEKSGGEKAQCPGHYIKKLKEWTEKVIAPCSWHKLMPVSLEKQAGEETADKAERIVVKICLYMTENLPSLANTNSVTSDSFD